MSDPVTNVEIEDVLSSIRKLVAEETRTPPVARKREKPGRLILTAAQRVKDDEPAPTASSEPVLLTQPINIAPDKVVERSIDEIPGDARLADFGEVEGAFPDIESFESGSDASADPQDENLDGLKEVQQDASEAHDDWTAGSEESEEGDHSADRSELNRLIEEEVSAALGLSDEDEHGDDLEDERRTEHAAEGWSEPEDGTDEAAAEHSKPEETHENQSEYDVDADTQHRASDHEQDSSEGDDSYEDDDWDVPEDDAAWHEPERQPEHRPEPPAPPQSLEDKVAALGRLVARDSQEFEEERDRPDVDDLAAASEPMAWPDAAPFAHVEDDQIETASNVLHAQDAWPQPQAYQPQSDADPEQEVKPAETALQTLEQDQMPALEIDEETLRLMVVDIVRQELQGALGERITRNVRKLVRREIHRMLISQDHD